MWFGTQDGLNRYDGYEFRIYRHAESQPGSLRDNYILSLFEDRAGTFWVGTNKGGLNRYDRQTEQFMAYVNNPNDPESLSLNAVNAIGEQRVWAICRCRAITTATAKQTWRSGAPAMGTGTPNEAVITPC